MASLSEILEEARPDQEVEFTAKVVEVLPALRRDDVFIDRLVVSDGTATVVLVVEGEPEYFLPGDVIRVRGWIKPCFYAPSQMCVAATGEGVDFVETPTLDLSTRRAMEKRGIGPFKLSSLLMVSKMDSEMLEIALSTELDPARIFARARSLLEQGKGVDPVLRAVTAMAIYSVFFRNYHAAQRTEAVVLLLKTLDLDEATRARLDTLEEFLRVLVEEEAFKPVLEAPPEPGIPELLPLSIESIRDLPVDLEAVRSVVSMVREARKPLMIVLETTDLDAARRVSRAIAGEAEAEILLVSGKKLMEEAPKVLADLNALPERVTPPAVVVFEIAEFFLPGGIMAKVMPPPIYQKAREFSKEVIQPNIERLMKPGVIVVLVTASRNMLDESVLSRVDSIIRIGEAAEVPTPPSEPELPY
ncbi:MAG: hypothetical protein DRO06_04330 [Thermoproteota archaeon]|nr:MAG: hypothetical protein DRO06_04330 [Candidatus Korarchaeota archaeon]